MRDDLRARVSELTGAEVVAAVRLSGGDFAESYRIELGDERTVFAKTHQRPPSGFFTTEAMGLRWLAEPGVVAVASVIGVADEDPACLVLEWIELGGRRTSRGEAALGRALAALHASGAQHFGRSDGRTTGSLALPNDPCDAWPEFYADRRLLPLARLAADRAALPASSVDRLQIVSARLDQFGATEEPPARLHGDLWAGNRVVDSTGTSWLIDPAAHGGHREFDLAMMRLFGGFDASCFAAYEATTPLADGWHDRVPLHQLAPLVVHAIKFGGSYVGAVADALDQLC